MTKKIELNGAQTAIKFLHDSLIKKDRNDVEIGVWNICSRPEVIDLITEENYELASTLMQVYSLNEARMRLTEKANELEKFYDSK